MNRRLIGVLIAAAVLLATGLSTGTRVYYLMAILLCALCLLSLISVIAAIFTLSVSVKSGQARVTRGEGVNLVFTVSHASILPVGELRLYAGLDQGAQQEISARIPPFSKHTFRCRISCSHRGIYASGVGKVAACDLFGLFQMRRTLNARPMRVMVLPKRVEAEPMMLEASDMGVEMRALSPEDNASPSGIRSWQDGDSLKKVHWKLSMRRREVLVRTYEETARPDTLVIPNLSHIALDSDGRLSAEDAVCEQSLGAAEAQMKLGFPVRMPLTSAKPMEVSGQSAPDAQAFADALMRVQFDSPYPYEKVLMLMQARIQRTGGAILVTPELSERCADMAMRMQRSGVRTRVVLVGADAREETLEMLEKLKMAGVQVSRGGAERGMTRSIHE